MKNRKGGKKEVLHLNEKEKLSHHGGEGGSGAELIDPLSVCRKSNGDWRGNDKRGLERDRDKGGEEWNDSTDTPVNKTRSGCNERL